MIDLVYVGLRLLQEALRVLQGRQLRTGEEDPRVQQHRQDRVQVVLVLVPLLDLCANPVQTELVVDLLEEEVAAVEAALFTLPYELALGTMLRGIV